MFNVPQSLTYRHTDIHTYMQSRSSGLASRSKFNMQSSLRIKKYAESFLYLESRN
jgi:hypothetical protein